MRPIAAATATEAWLKACEYLLDQKETAGQQAWREFNVILEIANPMSLPTDDLRVVQTVDQFLRSKQRMPVNTVVNTLFPAQLYQRHGAKAVFEQYSSVLYPEIKSYGDCKWGTYAQRIIERRSANGATVHPLKDLIAKLQAALARGSTGGPVYEINVADSFLDIPIFDSGLDRKRPVGGPCLSHLSFKVSKDRRLLLTALYRDHFYIEKALGNLLGLGHLLHFVATESGLAIGPLVCVSTLAVLDHGPAWGKADVRALLSSCKRAIPA